MSVPLYHACQSEQRLCAKWPVACSGIKDAAMELADALIDAQAAGPNINRVISLCGPTGYIPTAKWLPAGVRAWGISRLVAA